MKLLTGKKDYVCTSGKPSDISSFLNKIGRLYNLKILSTCSNDQGMITIIVERTQMDKMANARPPVGPISMTED